MQCIVRSVVPIMVSSLLSRHVQCVLVVSASTEGAKKLSVRVTHNSFLRCTLSKNSVSDCAGRAVEISAETYTLGQNDQ